MKQFEILIGESAGLKNTLAIEDEICVEVEVTYLIIRQFWHR